MHKKARFSQWLTIVACLMAAISAILMGHGLYFITQALQPVPIADHMDMLLNAAQYLNGTHTHYLLSPHNEHRPFTTNVALLLDVHLFSGTGYFLIVVNILMMLVTAGVLASMFRTIIPHRPLWGVSVALTTVLLSLGVNVGNVLWATQTQFHCVFLCALLACWGCARGIVHQEYGALVLGLVAGSLSTFSMANGLLVWPVLLLGACLFRAHWRVGALVTVMGVLAWLAYFYLPGSVLSHGTERVFDLTHFAVFALVYLGGPVSSWQRHAGIALACIGLIGLVALHIRIWRRGFPRQAAWIALVLFVDMLVASALLTAFGRASAGLTPQTTPRYYLPALLFWSSVFALGVSAYGVYARTIVRTAVAGMATLVVLAVLVQHFEVITQWQAQMYDAWVVNAAIATGVEDPGQFVKIYPWSGRVQQLRPVIAQRQWSTFATWLPASLGRHFSPAAMAALPVCMGEVESLWNVPTLTSHRFGAKLQGWLQAPGRWHQSDLLLVLDAAHRVIGMGVATPPAMRWMMPTAALRPWIGYAVYEEARAYAALLVLHGSSATPQCRIDVTDTLPTLGTAARLDTAIPASVHVEGRWEVNGFSAAMAPPDPPVPVYGSWCGSDQHTGSLRIGPFSVPDHVKSFAVQIGRGPTADGLSLVLTTGTGTILRQVAVKHLAPHEWTLLEIPVPATAPADDLYLIATDEGTAWGAWFVVSGPHGIAAP